MLQLSPNYDEMETRIKEMKEKLENIVKPIVGAMYDNEDAQGSQEEEEEDDEHDEL